MKKQIFLLAAGVLWASGVFYSASRADDAPAAITPATQTDELSDADLKAVKHALGQATDAMMTRDGFTNLSQFVQIQSGGADGAVGPFKNYDDINNALDLLARDWKYKYNVDFNISVDNETAIFKEGFRIYHGDQSQPKVATVEIPPAHDMRALTMHLAAAGQPVAWKVLLAHGDERAIHDSVLKQLNFMHDQRNNWPADSITAGRMAVDHLLTALTEAGVGQAGR